MKSMRSFFISIAIVNSSILTAPQKLAAQTTVSFQVFYNDLSPYGSWVNNSSYGYCWVPRVGHGFRPYYTAGYWIFTEDGWTWVSDYSWGWAPFHYGRWFYDSYYGWVWVPDTEWGPAWVCWRKSDDYYGWAPIGPGVSIDLAYSNNYNLPYNQWTFVRNRDFGRRNINNYYVHPSGNVTIIRNTTVINNIHPGRSNERFNAGPERTEVEKHAGRTFTPLAIKENNQAGQHLGRGQLELYRPRIEKNNDAAGHSPAPPKVMQWRSTKPATNATPPPDKNQPGREQPIRDRNNQPAGQESRPTQPQRNDHPPVQPQSPQQQRRESPSKEQSQPQRQTQRNDHPPMQHQQHNNPPGQQPPSHPPRKHDH